MFWVFVAREKQSRRNKKTPDPCSQRMMYLSTANSGSDKKRLRRVQPTEEGARDNMYLSTAVCTEPPLFGYRYPVSGSVLSRIILPESLESESATHISLDVFAARGREPSGFVLSNLIVRNHPL